MNENQPYTQSMEVAPVDPERDFARSTKDPYALGIAGSPGRSFSRPAYESGGGFDNVMRQREMAQRTLDPASALNTVNSRSMTRTQYPDMAIKPPQEVMKSGGIYG
jgi:hypothetical protein